MKRRSTANQQAAGVSLFPFLAALLCTIGAMVIVLVVIARHTRVKVDEERRTAAAGQAGELAAKGEELQWKIDELKKSREATQKLLADKQTELSHLEEHARRLKGQLEEAVTAREHFGELAAGDARQNEELRKRLARVRIDADRTRAEVEELKRKGGSGESYAIIPYHGPNETRRRPIYIECRRDKIVLQPEGVELAIDDDFTADSGATNPLASTLRAVTEYHRRNALAGRGGAASPYPLFIVRPDGIKSWFAAREAISSWGSDFGYELVGQDWKFDFPPPDARLTVAMREAIAEAKARQAMIARDAPLLAHSSGGGGIFRASRNGGIVQVDGSPGGVGRRGRGRPGLGSRRAAARGDGFDGGGPAFGGGGIGPQGPPRRLLATSDQPQGDGPVHSIDGDDNPYTSALEQTGNGTGGGGPAGGGPGAGGAPYSGGTSGRYPPATGLAGGAPGLGPGGGPGGQPGQFGMGPATGLGQAPGLGQKPGLGLGQGGYGQQPGGGAGNQPGAGLGPGLTQSGSRGTGGGGGVPNGSSPPPGGSPAGNTLAMGGPLGGGGYGSRYGRGGGQAAGTGADPAGQQGMSPDGGRGDGTQPGGMPGATQPGGKWPNGIGPNGTGARGTVPGSAGTVPGSAGTVPGSAGTVPGSAGTGGQAAGTGAPGQGSSGPTPPGGNGNARQGGGQPEPGIGLPGNRLARAAGAGNSRGSSGTAGSGTSDLDGTGRQTQATGGGPSVAASANGVAGAQVVDNGSTTSESLAGPSTRSGSAGGQSDSGSSTSAAGGTARAGSRGGLTRQGNSGSPNMNPIGQQLANSQNSSGGSGQSSSMSGQQASSTGGGSSSMMQPMQGGMPSPNFNFGQQDQQASESKHHKQRERNWANPDASTTNVPIQRPIRMVCDADHLTLLAEGRGRQGMRVIPLKSKTEDSVEDLVSTVWDRIESWGTAGRNMYWRPTLIMEVEPGGQRRYAELQALLADSGFDVHGKPRTRAFVGPRGPGRVR